MGSSSNYHITVKHIYEDNGKVIKEIVTLDEYAPAGTQYTVQTIESPTLSGYEDGVWEMSWGKIEGGNSTLEENYHDLTLLPLQSTTFNLIPDNTYVEYHYMYTPNLHVVYQWTNAPESAQLPIDNKGYRNGYIYRDSIKLDKTYTKTSVIEEGNYTYTFSGWKMSKVENNIVYLVGSWEKTEKPVEEEPEVPETPTEPEKPSKPTKPKKPKEEKVPEMPRTGI